MRVPFHGCHATITVVPEEIAILTPFSPVNDKSSVVMVSLFVSYRSERVLFPVSTSSHKSWVESISISLENVLCHGETVHVRVIVPPLPAGKRSRSKI